MNWSVFGPIVALMIFVAGLIYDAGVKAQRLKALEDWRTELRQDMKELGAKIDKLADLIRGEEQ